jgi:hypothetical protein
MGRVTRPWAAPPIRRIFAIRRPEHDAGLAARPNNWKSLAGVFNHPRGRARLPHRGASGDGPRRGDLAMVTAPVRPAFSAASPRTEQRPPWGTAHIRTYRARRFGDRLYGRSSKPRTMDRAEHVQTERSWYGIGNRDGGATAIQALSLSVTPHTTDSAPRAQGSQAIRRADPTDPPPRGSPNQLAPSGHRRQAPTMTTGPASNRMSRNTKDPVGRTHNGGNIVSPGFGQP